MAAQSKDPPVRRIRFFGSLRSLRMTDLHRCSRLSERGRIPELHPRSG